MTRRAERGEGRHQLALKFRRRVLVSLRAIRPECHTPRYAADTRTDFLLASEGITLTVKLAQPRILEQLPEDTAYYRRERKCRTLVAFVYDPEASLREPCLPPAAGTEGGEELEVRYVVGSL
ncbi:MAG TPA: hypothetical protein VH575_32010 [Gemmataceae bacterium]